MSFSKLRDSAPVVGSLAGTAAVALAAGLVLARVLDPFLAVALLAPLALAAAAHDLGTLRRVLHGERFRDAVTKPAEAAEPAQAELIAPLRSAV